MLAMIRWVLILFFLPSVVRITSHGYAMAMPVLSIGRRGPATQPHLPLRRLP